MKVENWLTSKISKKIVEKLWSNFTQTLNSLRFFFKRTENQFKNKFDLAKTNLDEKLRHDIEMKTYDFEVIGVEKSDHEELMRKEFKILYAKP